MVTHSSILAWEITWTEEPGRLQSMGRKRVRCDLATKQQHGFVSFCYVSTVKKLNNQKHYL